MNLKKTIINLIGLLFSITSSHAEISINKCKTNGSEYVIFDEKDSQIAENIIEYQLHNQPDLRENSIIKIFANENNNDRNYWIASFEFEDQDNKFLFYQVDQNKFTEIDQTQFQILLPKIVECNNNKLVPIYSENVDAD
ncbi:hypothetical protein A9G34_02395 [Gilliamella sp. Choc4-2]|uniref:hypothetical protein n=1 Tax=unclassified Gilliamella TaxID=2685620 RepID=UPI00080EBE34|nr:hypothetical protein [Gilliamella apicola]OCG30268.1 hypothetical protein A9G33_07830 [Gilliamella apicola]OCG47208.1 hypothetical protein A9G34_02395 [Gilliamella apicola]OCG55342.1 hypothetical protein A9G36_05115 [Gilliamella apicola]